MRYYLSGPSKGLPDRNQFRFQEALQRLRKDDLDIYCPVEVNSPTDDKDAENAQIKSNLTELLKCDALIVIPWWGSSEEAKIEVAICLSSGIPIYYFDIHATKPLKNLANAKIITRAEMLAQ